MSTLTPPSVGKALNASVQFFFVEVNRSACTEYSEVACILIDKLGRRPLFIMSMAGMACSSFAVGLYFMLQSPGLLAGCCLLSSSRADFGRFC